MGRKAVQVVLATHSAELLDFMRPEAVRFLSRNPEDGSVIVSEAPTGDVNWERAFKKYKSPLSSAWLFGGLGGVPGTCGPEAHYRHRLAGQARSVLAVPSGAVCTVVWELGGSDLWSLPDKRHRDILPPGSALLRITHFSG